MLLLGLSSCEDQLELVNPNQMTTSVFGKSVADLEEVAIACYNRIRIEGTYARCGYLLSTVAADEINSYSDNDWWRPADYCSTLSNAIDNNSFWVFRDWFYSINTCNYLITYVDQLGLDSNNETYKRLRGQGLFFRALAYYELATQFQDVPLITDYSTYTSMESLYVKTVSQSEVLDQVEMDFSEAMSLLPSRDEGGEWAQGRATCGAAAGYYARTLMFRHKFDEALVVLKDIIDKKYGYYELNDDYGDNFRSTVENTAESLWEVQFLEYGVGGSDMEWAPVNNSKNSTQGQALETVFGNPDIAGWNDLGATPWLYQTFKSQKTINGTVDPRLYWTLITYEEDYNTMEGFANTAYTMPYTKHVTTGAHKGISIAKHTTARENLYSTVPAVGLSCGVNLRLMRYSDVLLRAAECENEINGPTQNAIDWINEVRERADLKGLSLSDFDSKEALFEQIANVERPTEFGCEHGRMQDLIRWGFFYKEDRLSQIRKHASTYWGDDTKVGVMPASLEEANDDPLKNWMGGHEYFPINETELQANYNLEGNSANRTESNISFYEGYNIHPVVSGIGVQ